MKINRDLTRQLESIFAPLNKVGAGSAFPPPASLSSALEKLFHSNPDTAAYVNPKTASLFATAAVDVWLRAVHSFLISASLTEASPIWASVTGYYSSHYSVRAIAHLLGYFQLFRLKRVVHLNLQSGQHICSFNRKQGQDREHRLYWKVVKSDPHFVSDGLFTDNNPGPDGSDVGHRDRANYADHLCQFPSFHALDAAVMKLRVQKISEIEFTTPPIPNPTKFPEVESVQIVAYHRIVTFRNFLDEVLGESSRFWKVHRSPSWTAKMIDFQITEPSGLTSFKK